MINAKWEKKIDEKELFKKIKTFEKCKIKTQELYIKEKIYITKKVWVSLVNLLKYFQLFGWERWGTFSKTMNLRNADCDMRMDQNFSSRLSSLITTQIFGKGTFHWEFFRIFGLLIR